MRRKDKGNHVKRRDTDKRARWRSLLAVGLLCGPLLAVAQTHVVRPGETLWGVAKDKLQTPARWRELQQRNHVDNPLQLQPGTVLDLGTAPLALPKDSPGAVVAELEGTGWLKRDGAQLPLAVGMPVLPGDVLVTQDNTFVRINLADGSRVVLPSASALRVDAIDDKRVRLHLLEGRVESHVQKQPSQRQFEVNTRSVGLGVRGTHFRVHDEDGLVSSEVIEGVVLASAEATPEAGGIRHRLGAKQETLLRAGSGVVLNAQGSLEVKALLPAPQLLPQEPGDGARRIVRVAPQPEATGYRLQLARDAQFLTLVYEQRTQQAQFTLPPALDDGAYQMRLTAFDHHGIEGLPGHFNTRVLPKPPEVAHTRRLPDGRYEVRWPGADQGAYRFVLSRRPDFSLRLVEETVVNKPGVTVGPLTLPGRYYWYGEALAPEGNPTPAAASGSFDVPNTPLP